MKTSESQTALIGALLKARKAFPAIAKTKTVNAGRMTFKYAPMESVLDAVTPALLANGLVMTQGADGHAIITRLDHESGEWREFSMPMNAEHGNMQNYGIELTYRRRYSVQMMLGIVTEDDTDGRTAKKAAPRMDGLSEARVAELENLAADMLALVEEGRTSAAIDAYYNLPDNEEKLCLWGFLRGPGGGSTPESRLRSLIKANPPAERKAA